MNKKVCYVSYPYTARRDTGRGHDEYAHELISRVGKKDIDTEVWEGPFKDTYGAGGIGTSIRGAIEELVFPFKFRKATADIFHATSPIGARTAILLKKRPLITTIHDVIHLFIKSGYDILPKHRYKAWCIELAAKKSDYIVTIFEFNKDVLISKFKVSPKKIKVIPIGIDHKKFFPGPKASSSSRKIVFAGEVTRSKGVDTLIKAFSAIIKKMSDVKLVIGSTGRDMGFMRNLVSCLGLDGKVEFLGFIPDEKLQEFFAQAEIAVFPSHYGFGLPTLEAMACGTPTISGDTLDAPEFVKDAGLLVKPGNESELASAMLEVLRDNSLAAELRQKGIDRAREFTWDKMADETAKFYQEILA
ncbi:MAG: glycosyltransferase family 1 protein [Candidatus Omnitrophota bacterium]